MSLKPVIIIVLVCVACLSASAQNVSLSQTDKEITLTNKYLSASFTIQNANLSAIHYAGRQNVLGAKGRAYLLGPGFSMAPANMRVVRTTPQLAEIAFTHVADNHFTYELHYILKNDVSGVYCYLVQSHKASDSTGVYGQTRWGISADPQLYDYHLVRDGVQGPMPAMTELNESEKVQDWTYKLADSSIYTKYDYADYIDGRHVHGMAGQKSGLGMFVIQASHEYLDGGPTKQFQNVHATPFLINMFNCGHFLSDIRKADDKITDDWVKLDGPFLLYLDQGKDIASLWADAKKQSVVEMKQWPYTWMDNTQYPLVRGTVKGTLNLAGGKAAAGAKVILAAPGYDWQAQTSGYIYWTDADAGGNYTLNNVRPGNYTLYAYGANVMDEYKKDGVSVTGNAVTNMGKLTWQPLAHGNTLWQIGIADRKTTGFKLADHRRVYGLFNEVPADLGFTIGKSREKNDFYYAQTKAGSWHIIFDDANKHTGNATLTFAVAGAARKPVVEVYVNDTLAGRLDGLGNDASVYRSAILGGYYQQKEISFPASILHTGTNTIALKLVSVKPGGGVMYDAIKLEVY